MGGGGGSLVVYWRHRWPSSGKGVSECYPTQAGIFNSGLLRPFEIINSRQFCGLFLQGGGPAANRDRNLVYCTAITNVRQSPNWGG